MTIECPTCSKTLADNAKTCPGCGHVIQPTLTDEILDRDGKGGLIGFVGILVLLLIGPGIMWLASLL